MDTPAIAGNNTLFLGFGANLGDRAANLREALNLLEGLGLKAVAASAMYETPPWGIQEQPAFLNLVAEFESDLPPGQVLQMIAQVEHALGRVRTQRYGPRTIDIDILAFGQQVVAKPELQIPHPQLAVRAFVLVPWAEIAPDFEVPGSGKSVMELLSGIEAADVEAVETWGRL